MRRQLRLDELASLVEVPERMFELELIEWCRSRLARYKCLHSVDFWEALRRNETGKLFKRQLREEYRRRGEA